MAKLGHAQVAYDFVPPIDLLICSGVGGANVSEEDDYEQPTSGSGGMVEHIQKYKNYIEGLKKGQSSGISAAFGRASDLLPADVLEVSPPKGATAVAPHDLNERVFADDFDRAALRTAVEGLITSCAEQLDQVVGTIVMTAEGPSEVVNCFVEDGQRRFMLANLDVIDEEEFNSSRKRSSEELIEEESEDSQDIQKVLAMFEDSHKEDDVEIDSDNQEFEKTNQERTDDDAATVEYVGVDENIEAGEISSNKTVDESENTVLEPREITKQVEHDEHDEYPAVRHRRTMEKPLPSLLVQSRNESPKKFGEIFDSPIFDEERPFDLVVHTPSGSVLWGVHYDGLEIDQVVMADGTQIRRAEGRYDYVMVQRSHDRLHPRVYILSGVMVDPETGNIYVEANQGGYTAAFLNNGWQIHQYRSRDSKDSFYAKEPDRPGRPGAFLEVINLVLDVQSGEVTYETADSAATVTLKSRKL